MPHFKVKAVYEYASPHDDDLNFDVGQIITVTEEEGDDWYVGEYVDAQGATRDGLFPRNFVERYEPAPPPRPNRMSRHRPLEQPAPEPAPPTPEVPQQPPPPHEDEQHEEQQPQPARVELPPAAKPQQAPPAQKAVAVAVEPKTVAEPAAAPPPAKKAPPPVATKSSSFRDRIAAFNQTAAPPIAPFKPGGGPPSSFIKKPFVAPPPSRNAYVPPPTREQPSAKTYRREEDPEIAERQAQDQENAERAGLATHGAAPANEPAEDQPKPTSLKERIALLQKQQAEQAQRAAAALHKEKPRKPPVRKRTETHEDRENEVEGAPLESVATNESKERGSLDHARPPRTSHDLRPADSATPFSDANDADQSAAGDTEEAEGTSTSVEDDEERARHRAAPAKEPDVGDEEGAEEEEEGGEDEEDEMDAETRRKLELRERMAKMSGGMGMAGMFGAPMGPLPPKKKPPTKKSTGDSEEHAVPQPMPMFAIPGLPVRSPEPMDRQPAVEKDDEDATHGRDAEVFDIEHVTNEPIQRPPTGDRAPPIPSEKRPLPPRILTSDRPTPPPPPPVPAASRPPPLRSLSTGSESGDEMTDAPEQSLPKSPAVSQSKRSSYLALDDMSQDSPERRMPPIPLTSPTSPSTHRPPPPPPPAGAPRQPTLDSILRKTNKAIEGESEYEGDYDTDIAPGASHKDALKSHAREPSFDGSTIDDISRSPATGVPPPVPSVHRAVPPPPPRASVDTPRGPPPPPPVPRDFDYQDEDEDYDPYRAAPPAPRSVPPPPQSQPPPPQSRPPPPFAPPIPTTVPTSYQEDSSEEDDLYSAPSRKSHDRPPPPPPQSPPHHAPLPHRPPPTQDRPVPPPPPGPSRGAPARKSLDVNRVMQGSMQGARSSMDQPRASYSQEFLASDVDLGASSHWWTQPDAAPPSLQGRKDVLLEKDETRSGNAVEKMVFVLYMDYSQTIITARFSTANASDVQLEQRLEAPPPKLRQDQLEAAHERFGTRIAKDIESRQNTIVGDGSPHALISELLSPYKDVLRPISTRAFGALVYANLANASITQHDEIRPGDVISFRNAKFQGKHGAMHAKYSLEVGRPDHVGVVVEWDGSKKKVRVWEQGRESRKVKAEGFRMGDLRSGEVRVWRVMGRGWVGWRG